MYLDVRLLIKRTMSPVQRKLFAFQKDRLPMLDDSDSFDSDLDIDKDIRKTKSVNEFIQLIGQYTIETDLDRKLLLGVLVRDCHLKRTNSQSSKSDRNSINNYSATTEIHPN